MNKIVSFLTAVCFMYSAASGAESWSGSVNVDFVSQYIGFCNGGVFYDKPMFQTDIYLQHKSGFHADIWWGTGLNDDLTSSGFDDETDWNIGFAKSVKKFQFDVGVGYWDIFPTFFKDSRNDIVHPYAEVGYPLQVKKVSLVPFVKWDGYFLPFETDFEEGNFFTAGSKYNIPLVKKLNLTGLAAVGYDDGGFCFTKGFVSKLYVNLEWNLTKWFTWKVFEFQEYLPIDMNDREHQEVYGTGVCFKF